MYRFRPNVPFGCFKAPEGWKVVTRVVLANTHLRSSNRESFQASRRGTFGWKHYISEFNARVHAIFKEQLKIIPDSDFQYKLAFPQSPS